MALPGNLSSKTPIDDLGQTRLARKLYLIEPSTAFAFSGLEKNILDCLDTINSLMPSFSLEENPLERIRALVDDQQGKASIIGAHARPLDGLIQIFRISGSSFQKIGALGDCSAIGSGAGDLMRMVGQFESTLDVDTPEKKLPQNLIRGTASAINNLRLAADMAPQNRDDWGGFVEYSRFDLDLHRWLRGPPSVHMFMTSEMLDDNTMTTRLLGKVIAYDPGGAHARILSISSEPGGAFPHETLMLNLLERDEIAIEPRDFWLNWRPRSGTVTILPLPGSARAITKSTNDYELGRVIFEIGGWQQLRFGLSDDYCDELSTYAAERRGLRYVASRTLQ